MSDDQARAIAEAATDAEFLACVALMRRDLDSCYRSAERAPDQRAILGSRLGSVRAFLEATGATAGIGPALSPEGAGHAQA